MKNHHLLKAFSTINIIVNFELLFKIINWGKIPFEYFDSNCKTAKSVMFPSIFEKVSFDFYKNTYSIDLYQPLLTLGKIAFIQVYDF